MPLNTAPAFLNTLLPQGWSYFLGRLFGMKLGGPPVWRPRFFRSSLAKAGDGQGDPLIQTSHISEISYSPHDCTYTGIVELTFIDPTGETDTVSVKTDMKTDGPLDGVTLSLQFTQAAVHLWRLFETTESKLQRVRRRRKPKSSSDFKLLVT